MARLIDADAAKLTANDYAMFRCQLGGLVDVVEFLDDMPAVDAVPVVRCKDCIYSYEEFGFIYCTFEPYGDCKVPSQFYCAEGKRKEDK